MFGRQAHSHNLSLRLSQVLNDIGVNKTMIMKRRKIWLLQEAIINTGNQLIPNFRGNISAYLLGSQTEGSTTKGLNSDLDHLLCIHVLRILQDWSQWQSNMQQCLMVQDETTSPGYCLLQLVRRDVPLPMQEVLDERSNSIDIRRRVLLRHFCCLGHIQDGNGVVRHGPAGAEIGGPGQFDIDFVPAFYSSSWPKEAEPWLCQQNASGWPTAEMKRYSVEHGCFLVPVASKTGVYQDLEWRISTSLAERCLMFNLNITQIRCYILMKMILKTFLKPKCGETVSSFMCKNILFHCIAESESRSSWNKGSLMLWLKKCLTTLFHCILTDNCPHFMIPGNNLLAGKLSAGIKHQLVDVMCSLIENLEQSLMGIQIDDLGNRLHVKSGGLMYDHLQSAYDIASSVASVNIIDAANMMFGLIREFHIDSLNGCASVYQIMADSVIKLCQLYQTGNTIDRLAINLYTPFLCTSIGSLIASQDIELSQFISPAAMSWYSVGLKSDILSGGLKFAAALYCVGYLESCEFCLAGLRRKLSQTPVLAICSCCVRKQTASLAFQIACYEKNEHVIKHNLACCVKYLPCEVNCIPKELQYELFQSTAMSRTHRSRKDIWMDFAVVDSLPYLYFLQYKVYRRLYRPEERLRALHNLVNTTQNDPNLGHREIALNILGQCMEQENRTDAAFCCYMMSLNVRGRNNAAKWHICRLLADMFTRRP